MTAALLLLAAAVCVAPWTTSARSRLDVLVSTGTGWARELTESVPAAVRRFLPPPRRERSAADPATLAQLLDLLGVSLLAGLPVPDALAAVAEAVDHTDPALAGPLRAVAARIRLGATPAQAWNDVPGGARVAPVRALLVRACDGGGSVRSALEHTSARLRSEADSAATARAERAAVMVAGPLGLCFLPAFICLGVLPVVVGLADGMLPDGLL